MLPRIGKHCVWEQGAIKAVQLQSQCQLQWSATVASSKKTISQFFKESDSMIVHEDVGSRCKQLVRKCVEQYNLLQVYDRC